MTSYPLVNEDPSSPYYQQHYFSEPATNNGRSGVYHVYHSGAKVFVADPPPLPTATPIPVPNPPVAATPAASPPSSTPSPSNPTPTFKRPEPGNWDPNASASTQFVNTSGQVYQVQDASVNGEWHIYKDGNKKVWSPGASWEQPHMTPAQYEVYKAQHPGGATTPPAEEKIIGQPASGSGSGGGTYIVKPNDTLSSIATSTGIPLSRLEELNKQLKNVDMIHPGEHINLGGGGAVPITTSGNTGGIAAPAAVATAGNSSPGSAPPAVSNSGNDVSARAAAANSASAVSERQSSSGTSNASGGSGASTTFSEPWSSHPMGQTAPGSSSESSKQSAAHDLNPSGAGFPGSLTDNLSFPNKSSYPSVNSAAADKAFGSIKGNQVEGWIDGAMHAAPDVAKQVFEADTHPNTDPLKINDRHIKPSSSP